MHLKEKGENPRRKLGIEGKGGGIREREIGLPSNTNTHTHYTGIYLMNSRVKVGLLNANIHLSLVIESATKEYMPS